MSARIGRNLEGRESRLANEGLVRGADVQGRLPENESDATLVSRELERRLGFVGNRGLGSSVAIEKRARIAAKVLELNRVSS